MKTHDWRKLPVLKSPTGDGGGGETKWVFPDKFLDELPVVLKDAPTLPSRRLGALGSVVCFGSTCAFGSSLGDRSGSEAFKVR